MVVEPREAAVVESYPTFWTDDNSPTPRALPTTEEPYTDFVNYAEDDLPEDTASEAD